MNRFRTVEKLRKPCPICGHTTWCAISVGGKFALCARVEQGCMINRDGSHKMAKDGQGYLHLLRDDPQWKSRPRVERAPIYVAPFDAKPYASMLAWMTAGKLADAARRLFVSPDALRSLGIGWDRQHQAWAFPMRDGRGQVIGVRLRKPGGAKFCVKGSHNGMFVPSTLDASRVVLIVEGPTDTAAALTLGFNAVGRPSNTGGHDLLVTMIRDLRPPMVAIVRNNDPAGSDAERLTNGAAERLGAAIARMRIRVVNITPPAKDLRAWIQAGATRGDVETAIRAAMKPRKAVAA